MRVLVVEPYKEPYEKEIDPGLESLQHEVGGDIEVVYPFDDPVAVICNEEGKLEGLTLNRSLRDGDGEIYDVLCGTFLVVGLGEENFDGLSKEQMDKFKERFKTPEQFIFIGGNIVSIPLGDPPFAPAHPEPPHDWGDR
ncbi:MAG: DUF3846 domain-containing protein [Clostridia bacterium]|nr:DUF3846 domain-containing protein [Clostridia bacterium]